MYLNLVLEYVPETVYRAMRHYTKVKQTMPMLLVKLYMYQIMRSLAYIHSLGICHRDIKPQNLLSIRAPVSSNFATLGLPKCLYLVSLMSATFARGTIVRLNLFLVRRTTRLISTFGRRVV